MGIYDLLEAAQKSEENWLNGICPKCQGDGCEYPRRADGSYLSPIDCHYCGGTGNIVGYVTTLIERLEKNKLNTIVTGDARELAKEETMPEEQILALIAEWKEILPKQREIKNQRGKGCVGILVSGDDLAREYQAMQARIWEIKCAIFGDYYMGA